MYTPRVPFRESRRSTRVPLRVVIVVEGGAECEAVTIIVNLHGALIATAIGLSAGMRISIYVPLTDKRSDLVLPMSILRTRCTAVSNWTSR